jgi:gluconolactonase
MFSAPPTIDAHVVARLPDALRSRRPRDASGGDRDAFLEGPAVAPGGALFVTDLHNGRILALRDGAFQVVCEYDGLPNGLKRHRDGRLFVACNRYGIITVDPSTGRIEPVVSAYHGERFRGPNDLVFASSGDLYFTDPGTADLRDPHGRVFRLRAGAAPDTLELLLDRVPFPNGVVLSPDETLLYVAMTRTLEIWRAHLGKDGALQKVGVFVRLSGGLSGPDGLAADEAGNLAIAHFGMGTVWLVSRVGEPVARVRVGTGLGTSNVAYGGPDRRTLFITEAASNHVAAAEMPVPGVSTFG